MSSSLTRDQIELVRNQRQFNAAFKTLNLEWLEKYFVVEPIDEQVLSHPENIIEVGGHIFFACHQQIAIGTCALIRITGQRFELSKMAVNQKYQGQGIGRLLLEEALRFVQTIPGSELYLETNRLLGPAIALYESVGFVHAERPGGPSPYARANVYMDYAPSARSGLAGSEL